MGKMCCKGTTYFCYCQKSRCRVLLNGFNTRIFPSQQSLLVVLAGEKLWVGEQISISFTGREDRFADGRIGLNGFNTRIFPSQQSLLVVLAGEKLWVGEQISISFTGREDRFADGRIGFHQVDLSVTVWQLWQLWQFSGVPLPFPLFRSYLYIYIYINI